MEDVLLRHIRLALIRSVTLALALVATLLVTALPAPVRADGSALSFSPTLVSVVPGGSFSVDVLISAGAEIRGAQFGFTFDPSVLQVSSVTVGPFLKDWAAAHHGDAAAGVPFKVDNTKGEVSIGGIILLGGDSNGGPSGTGVLATVKGTSWITANAVTTLNFYAVKFASTLPDAAGLPDIAVSPGQVSVGGATGPALPAPDAPVLGPIPTDVPPPAPAPADPSGASGQAAPPPVASQTNLTASSATNTPVPPSGGTGGSNGAQPAPTAVLANEPGPNAAAPAIAAPITAPVAGAAPPSGAAASTPEVSGAQSSGTPGSNAPAPGGANASGAAPASAGSTPSDAQGQATAVAAAATATSLRGAIVAVTPPSVQQPQPPVGAANPTARPAGPTPAAAGAPAAGAPAARVTVVPRPVTAAAARPTGSGGLFIPWEVVGGIGGGIVAAGLVLYAFRRTSPRTQS
jgi:hypothetical protein